MAGLGNITNYAGGLNRTANYEQQQNNAQAAQAAVNKQRALQQQRQTEDRADVVGQSLGTINAGRQSPEEIRFNSDMAQIKRNQALQAEGKPGYDKYLQDDMMGAYAKTPYFERIQGAFAPSVPAYMGSVPPGDEGMVVSPSARPVSPRGY